MMRTENMVKLSLCVDCVYMDANGWDEGMTGLPFPDPAPLSRLPQGMLLGPAAHAGPCEDGVDGCDPCAYAREAYFSWHPCDGCGCTLGGDRFDYVGVFR